MRREWIGVLNFRLQSNTPISNWSVRAGIFSRIQESTHFIRGSMISKRHKSIDDGR